MNKSNSHINEISGFYESLSSMFSANIEEPEEIFFGFRRGEVGQLTSVTNLGKTTLILNACLSLAAGEKCPPLIEAPTKPKRVLYVDFESTRGSFRKYISRMLDQIENTKLAKENFVPWIDASIGSDPLILSRPEHIAEVTAMAKDLDIDLVVVDPIAAAFMMDNENDNAEVNRRIMRPLKELATKTNASVLFSHHIGKPNESPNVEAAYLGRGASNFGALSRAVYTLVRDGKKGDGYVVLRCSKTKGPKFQDTLMRLNPETYWFERCNERPTIVTALTVQEVADFVGIQDRKVKAEEIIEKFASRASDTTVKRRLATAIKYGLLDSVGHGYYQSPETSLETEDIWKIEPLLEQVH